jgi:hypothetical protein
MNWEKVVTATDRCDVVRTHLQTKAQRHSHFYQDPRLLWSYYSGERNCGGGNDGPPGLDLPKQKGEPLPTPDYFLDAQDVWSADTVLFELPSCANLDMPRKSPTL